MINMSFYNYIKDEITLSIEHYNEEKNIQLKELDVIKNTFMDNNVSSITHILKVPRGYTPCIDISIWDIDELKTSTLINIIPNTNEFKIVIYSNLIEIRNKNDKKVGVITKELLSNKDVELNIICIDNNYTN